MASLKYIVSSLLHLFDACLQSVTQFFLPKNLSVHLHKKLFTLQVARCEHPGFKDLMWDLVYRYKLDDLERARVIFRWMSAKDMQNITFQTVPLNSPEEVLLSYKTNHGTFARIFEVMCR